MWTAADSQPSAPYAPSVRALVLDVREGEVEVVYATDDRPIAIWTVPLAEGAASLPETRARTREALGRTHVDAVRGRALEALVTSAVIGPFIELASGTGRATQAQVRQTVETLAAMGARWRRRLFGPERADRVFAGAVMVEVLMEHLHIEAVTATPGAAPRSPASHHGL